MKSLFPKSSKISYQKHRLKLKLSIMVDETKKSGQISKYPAHRSELI